LTQANQKKWFSQQESFIFGINTGSVLTTICLAIGGATLNYFMVGCVWTGIAKFFYFLHVVVLFGALGILGWAYWGILLFSYRLQDLKLDLEPFETKKDEFERISTSLLGIFFTGVILYIGAITATWISPLIHFVEVFMFQYLIFPLAVLIACVFILMQHFLHELMKKNKRIRLDKVLSFTRKLYSKWKTSQLPAHRTAINDLLSWKEKIETEKDFPFGFLTIAFAVATVFLPTIALFLPAIKTIIE
jgi:glucan phosphoethanolaminetransferase (alkaline phosphatase superfamily)